MLVWSNRPVSVTWIQWHNNKQEQINNLPCGSHPSHQTSNTGKINGNRLWARSFNPTLVPQATFRPSAPQLWSHAKKRTQIHHGPLDQSWFNICGWDNASLGSRGPFSPSKEEQTWAPHLATSLYTQRVTHTWNIEHNRVQVGQATWLRSN
jgi:hypothetical protein